MVQARRSGIPGSEHWLGLVLLTNGSNFSTAGDFSNTDSLTIGAGSTLAVKGNYTQGSSASLIVGLGGSSSSNNFSRKPPSTAARPRAALAVNVTLASGFGPAVGDSYPIVTLTQRDREQQPHVHRCE